MSLCGSAVVWVFASAISAGVPENVAPVSERIDDLAQQHCVSAGIAPADRTTDTEFLRRVWLDLGGRTPPVDAAAKVHQKPLNRAELVDHLLESADYAQHWGRLWNEHFTDRRPFEQQEYDARKLAQFLTASVKNNLPYDQLIRELLMGDGFSDCTGPVNFLLRYNAEPVALAGAVSQKFLGVSLQCAECHDHPHAAWKQPDFWGLAAHFSRLRKMVNVDQSDGQYFDVIERPRGELMIPDRKAPKDENGNVPQKTIFPQLPRQSRSPPDQPRRAVLVAWLTDPENPYVSRHVVNIVWHRLMGEKLIDNFDHWPADAANSPQVQVLNLLADDFAAHQFDVARLIRVIVMTEAYQRSGRPAKTSEKANAGQSADELVGWSRARVRPLSADQLHLSIAQAFGYHFDENDFRLAEATGEEFSYDLPTNSFSATPLSVGRSVALYNGEHVRGAVEFGAEALVRLYGESAGPEHIQRLFLALLSRKPTPAELEAFQDLAGAGDIREGLQDATWVILNSTEFVTNH